MLYFYVSIAYTITNLLLGLTLVVRSPRHLLHRFYLFCIVCLCAFGLSAHLIVMAGQGINGWLVKSLAVFLFSLIPFFFLHFIVIFLRRHDILRARRVLFGIYFAGLFSYAMVLAGYIPTPLDGPSGVAVSSYIYYITWMSVFFSIGIALLFSLAEGFSERVGKSNLLLTGFALLMLVLPSPFTESINYILFKQNKELYGLTSAFALLIAIYLIFRHKIMMTVYDAVRTALTVMNDVFIVTDNKFRLEIIRGAVSQLGYREGELIGRPLTDILTEKYYITNYLEYVHAGKMRECLFDASVTRRDGTKIIMDFSFSPVFEHDTIAGFVGIARDITRRKHAERSLAASEERFRRLAENAPDIIYRYRLLPDHGFDYVSPAAEDITAYSSDEFYARPELFLEMVHPGDRPLMEGYFRGEGVFGQSISVRLLTKDGRTIRTEQRTVPVYDEDGYRVAFEGVIRDVTEHKMLEEQLRQAQKFESLGVLAGGIAHDFNNILAIVLGYASTLREHEGEPERLSHHVGMIETAVARGSGIVRQLLMIARKGETVFAPLNINEVTGEVVQLLGETIPRTIDLSLRLMRDAPPVNADRNQIHQALMNLCLNARDAMPNGGILSLHTEVVPRALLEPRFHAVSAARYIKLAVADTGTGMSEQVREHLFDPFFTTKPAGKGTGLGLAVVYGIVKNHGGFIAVESEVNVGSIFSIYLPIIEDAAPVTTRVAGPETARTAPGNETILIVEDEEMLRELLASLFAENGYSVLVAGDGGTALDQFAAHRESISLVLTDMGLPVMGGWELAQNMIKMQPSIKMVFASGYFEPGQMAEMTAAGMKYFVQKPYNPTDLLSIIRAALEAEAHAA